MSDDIRLEVNAIESNHSSESPTSINNPDLVSLSDEVLLEEINNVKIMNQSNNEEKLPTKIQRVTKIMLQEYKKFNKSYYKPKELSIGPIHARSPNLMKGQLKLKLVERFVRESGKTGEALLEEIKAKVDKLRKSFDKRVIETYNNERLSRLLFLDGCSMLQFVTSYFSDDLKDFKITNGQATRINHDLLLAENQIPFLVLKLLMDSCDNSFRMMLKMSVSRFVVRNAPIGFGYSKIPLYFFELIDLIDAEDRVHLLDLLRAVLLFGDQNISEDNKDQRDSVSCDYIFQSRDQGCFSPCFRRIKDSFGNNIDAILRQMCRDRERCDRHHHDRDKELYPKWSFRNVQELQLAGIKLKPSASCSLKAISFTRKWFIAGKLELPTLIVDNNTASKLLNLVAYEMCLHDYKTNCMVTSYVNLLDLLIDSEHDVKALRAACILRNHLSSDVEVANLFNNIGYDCLVAPKDCYSTVKNEIEKHYQRKIVIWMAQVKNDQFKSPWTVIALLAAAIALILTAIQTWYAVHPKKN